MMNTKLQRFATYLQRVIGNKWSIIFALASAAAANIDRLLKPTGTAETNWAVGGTVLGLCFIGLLIHRVYVLESEKEPMLTLKFDSTKDEFRREGQLPYLPGVPALYVLVLPLVTSNKPLRRCVGRLADVSVLSDRGRWKSVPYGSSVKLRWQDQDENIAFEPLTLHPEGTSRQFLDVFSVSSTTNWVKIEQLPRVIENELNIAPKFRLAVTVVAEDEDDAGATAKITLEVEKTTDWAAPKIHVVRDLLGDE